MTSSQVFFTNRIGSVWRAFFVQHAVGMFGQIAGGLPLLLITALISHSHGLARAGQFTVVVGISAAVYSFALWEFRSYVVLYGFNRFSPLDYAAARGIAVVAATIVTMCASLWMGISLTLAIAVALYRICDAVVDLAFGFNIRFRGTSGALRYYAIQNVLKLFVLCIAGALSLTIDPRSSEVFISGSGLVVVAGAMFVIVQDLRQHPGPRLTLSSIVSLFFQARWFALATLGAVIMTTTPRIIVAWFYDGDVLGVVGVSLSITSFFGIAFFTTWLRYLPRFNTSQNRRVTAHKFLFEIAAMSVLAAFVSYFVLPSVSAFAFGFRDPGQLSISREVLVAGVLFFGSMSLANLYKATATPWMEFVVYLAAFMVVGTFTLVIPVIRSMAAMLSVAGVTMIVVSLFAVRGVSLTEKPEPD